MGKRMGLDGTHIPATSLGQILLITMMSALVCLGQTIASGESVPASATAPSLIVVWHDPEGLFRTGSERLARQVKDIFEAIGVETAWKQGETNPSADSSAVQVRVVLRPSEPSSWGLSKNVLGVCFIRTSPPNAAYIFFPAVARALGYRPQNLIKYGLTPRQRVAMARALSRVVAHEVVHAIDPGLDHAPNGLTADSLDGVWLGEGTKSQIHPRAAAVFKRELRKLSSPADR